MQKILFVGGGSIGHIAPSVAVWCAYKEAHPDAEALFVCTSRTDETDYLADEGLAYKTLDAHRLSISFPWKFLHAYRQSQQIIGSFDPALIFSKGGYVSVPLCLAAHKKNIPIVLHESDVVSGRANRLVARWTKKICLGFPPTYDIRNTKYEFTGNPTPAKVTQGSREEGIRITGFSGDRPVLLVTGGSQGAQAFNEVITENIEALLAHCDIIHLTGRGKTGTSPRQGYWTRPFVTDDLPHLYAVADLALSRAGAGNIAELAANAVPTILVPLRGIAHDHQYINAQRAAETGGCIHLEQKELDEKIVGTIRDLLEDEKQQQEMKHNMAKLQFPDASGQIVKIIEECLALDD